MLRKTVTLLLLAALAGCVASGGNGQAGNLADATTRAVYNNDYGGVLQNMDSTLQGTVTRAEVGKYSDQMHALGNYKGLTLLSAAPDKNVFYYRADFTSGAVRIGIKLDASGKLAAYRIFSNQT